MYQEELDVFGKSIWFAVSGGGRGVLGNVSAQTGNGGIS